MTAEYADVVGTLVDLIRFDTSNPTSPERPAAEYVAERLASFGLEPAIYESEPGRASVVARVAGSDPSADALLVHGHLDVVPAERDDWRHHPFGGEIVDDYVWGRGAIDMKDMDAMILSVLGAMTREGRKPRRDLVVAFLADEEAGGKLGAKFLVNKHPELFEGCTEAISEVGGYSHEISPDLRVYLIETAQKGLAWMRLRARGRAGHGSQRNDENAVTELATAVSAIGNHRFPTQLTPTVRAFLEQISELIGYPFDPDDPEDLVDRLGPLARFVAPTLSHTANPTGLKAGYKVNVIPEQAFAEIDGRFLPGGEEEFLAKIDALAGPNITRSFLHYDRAVEAPFEAPIVESMLAALRTADPTARIVPYCLSAGTDNKSFANLGIRGYGFVPLKLTPDLDFPAMFHGVDERVPVSALEFGCQVLDHFLTIA